MTYFAFEKPILHNDARYLSDSRTIVTPAQLWALAAEFPMGDPPANQRLRVRLLARVDEGAVVLGTKPAGETGFYQSVVQPAGRFQTIELDMPPGDKGGSILVQNASEVGPSRVALAFLGAQEVSAEARPATPQHAVPGLEEIVVDPSIFARFPKWRGTVPAGSFADWTGIITNADVFAFPEDIRKKYSTERTEAPNVPMASEHVLDWAPLAQAILSSGDTFRMAALGAGWGRWLSAGGALARSCGKDYALLGVEADAQHFAWLQRHMASNGFDDDHCTLLEAAVAGQPGFVFFSVGDSQAWYGQSIRSGNTGEDVRRVRSVTIEGVLANCSPLDYLHMDVQEAELDFLAYSPELLDDAVRTVNIGTHSLEIENGLRQLFKTLGWNNLFDVELGTVRRVRVGSRAADVEFGDGVQVWTNPKLTPRETAR